MENEDNTSAGSRPSYKAQFEECEQKLTEAEQKIETLTKEVSEKRSTIVDLEADVGEWEKVSSTHEEKISSLETKIKEKDRIIKENELRRFSSAYAKQEGEFAGAQSEWFAYSLYSTLFLTASVLFTIIAPHKGLIETEWYEQPGLYLLNAIFLTLFVYSIKQHSYYGHLKVDYANRKTLAQSYQHIIEDKEDTQIEKVFLEELVKIFASRPTNEKESVSVWEYLLKRRDSK